MMDALDVWSVVVSGREISLDIGRRKKSLGGSNRTSGRLLCVTDPSMSTKDPLIGYE